ncbi:AlkA N-terminal domain-containing protein, partial [Salmonella enterica subsp. enterica serovar Dublin]
MTLAKCRRGDNWNMKARRYVRLAFMLEGQIKEKSMFTLSWQPPYDWSWMLGFLAARAVDGVET